MEKRILIIDDEENMRHMMTALLSESGFIVDAVADGVKGLQKIEEAPYDFIFCDIRMPNMDGIEFLREMRQNGSWNSVPVVMITTEGSQAKVLEALQAGASGYVRKPFTADQIKEKLASLI